MKKYDAIIIGAGHNGLIAASYLSKKLKNVLVLERRAIVGGAASTEELHPGFKFSRFSYLCSLLRPVIIKELKLKERGLKFHLRDISSITPTLERGKFLLMNRDLDFTTKEIAKYSQKDANVYKEYCEFLSEVIEIWSHYQDKYPIDPGFMDKQSVKKRLHNFLLYLSLTYHSVTKRKQINSYIQLLSQSSAKLLDQWFESDILKATLVTDGIIGEMVSIDQPASAYVLLHHVMGEVIPENKGEWVFVEGGMGSISRILQQVAEEQGVEIKVNCPVNKIIVNNGRANGVQLEDGTVYESDIILSNCSPEVTFKNMLKNETDTLDKINSTYMKRINHIEYNGACTKFNIAVKELPQFSCFEGTKWSNPSDVLRGTIHLGCESMQTLRHSFNQITGGEPFSKNLFIDMTIPTIYDKTIAPEGKHIIQCLVQYTPYQLPNGMKWDATLKKQLRDQVFDTINSYAPNFKDSVIFDEVLTPFDLEQILNLTEGNIFHGGLGLDRLYSNRPAQGFLQIIKKGYNSYATPIAGLFLCGSGSHPGGGVMGSPGRNCANYISNFVI